jgi:hypothetical protein
MMKFKTDENMPVEAADDRRQAGHDAVTVADQQLVGFIVKQVNEKGWSSMASYCARRDSLNDRADS